MPRGKRKHSFQVESRKTGTKRKVIPNEYDRWGQCKYERVDVFGHTAFCRCGWRGIQTGTKTNASRQYKLHRRYPALSKKSLALAAKDMLKTFVMSHTMEMGVNLIEWRTVLGIFAEALSKDKSEQYTISTYYSKGRGEFLDEIDVKFEGFNFGELGDYEFRQWVENVKTQDYAHVQYGFNKLNEQSNLVRATKLLLHLDEKVKFLKDQYVKRAVWAVEWHELLLARAKRRAKKAVKESKKKTTWQYLKEKYPTQEAVEQVLAERTFSKSYTDLLQRLVKYHAKREV